MSLIDKVDAIIAPGRFRPRWGWHDDHREKDGTPEYLPALQQVRSEFAGLIDALVLQQLPSGAGRIFDGRCLQLGLGECQASHAVWMSLFRGGAVTIDRGSVLVDWVAELSGRNTHEAAARDLATQEGPYDFLFVDAGHDYEDARADFEDYGPMVRPGGIIAFHDSLPRKGYEEVEVWRFLRTLGERVHQIGTEVGIACVVQP